MRTGWVVDDTIRSMNKGLESLTWRKEEVAFFTYYFIFASVCMTSGHGIVIVVVVVVLLHCQLTAFRYRSL